MRNRARSAFPTIMVVLFTSGCAGNPLAEGEYLFSLAFKHNGVSARSAHYSSEARLFKTPDISRFVNSYSTNDAKLKIHLTQSQNKCVSSNEGLLSSFDGAKEFLVGSPRTSEYVVNLYFDERGSFDYVVEATDEEIHFFVHFEDCDDLADSLFSSYYMAIHELVHLEFYFSGKLDELTAIENEYWASRLSHCAYILNPGFTTLRTYRPTKTNEARRLRRKRSTTKANASAIGATLFHADLYDLVGEGLLTRDTVDFSEVLNWCETTPQ